MKILCGVIYIVICTISPIYSSYGNDNIKPGFVSVQERARRYSRTGLRAIQRRHFSGSNKHAKDNVVDAHFQVKKMTPYLDGRRRHLDMPVKPHWNTEASIKPRGPKTEDAVTQPDHQKSNQQRGRQVEQNKNSQIHMISQQRVKLPNLNLHAQSPGNKKTKNYLRDGKSNFVRMNVHKAPLSSHSLAQADPQKFVRLHNKRYDDALIMYTANNKAFSNKPPTPEVERIAPNGHDQPKSENNAPVPTAILKYEDTPQKSRSTRGEFKKRDIDNKYVEKYDAGKFKRNVLSDTLRKYIVSKNKQINMERTNNKEYTRIGSHEETVNQDSPYAIFYRMHPEALDELEHYIPIKPAEDHVGDNPSNKNKRLSVYHDHQVGSRPNINRVKLHKKVKKIANYRNKIN